MKCFDDGGNLVVPEGAEIQRADGCDYVSDEEYYY